MEIIDGVPEGWTSTDVKLSQENTIRRILIESGEPMTIEQIRQKTGGMDEVYIRQTVARLQAKWQLFVLGDKAYLFEKEYPL